MWNFSLDENSPSPLYCIILHANTITYICRLFAEQFSNLSVDLEGVLSMMSKHPQYNCVSQIKEPILVYKINNTVNLEIFVVKIFS